MIITEGQVLKNIKTLTMWVIIGQLLTAFVGRSLSALMIYISEDLSLNKMQLGFLPTALFIGQIIGTLPIGLLIDKKSVRKITAISMLMVGLSFLVFSWSQYYVLSLIAIVIAGIGYGGMHPSTNKAIVQMFPNDKASLPMGLKQMSITLGSAGSSLLLLPLAVLLGWRVALSIAILLLLTYSLFLYKKLLVLEGTSRKTQSTTSILSQMGSLIRNKMLLYTTGSAFLLMGIQVTFNTYLIFYLYEIKGWSIYSAGICLAISELSGAAGRVLWGVISDKVFQQNRWIVLIVVTVNSLIGIYFLHFVTSGVMILLLVICIGFSLSGFNGVWMNLAIESVKPEQSGTSSGFSVMVASVGVVLFPPLYGFLVEKFGYVAAGGFILSSLILCFLLLVIAYFETNNRTKVE